jgi:NAD(P)-dependent dehydrogenase (short-subunit alcohol dehydrogenase family)
VEPIAIDVDDSQSIKAARQQFGKKITSLDALINNAGISGGGLPQTALDTDISVARQVFATNLFGIIEVTQAFMDLLR